MRKGERGGEVAVVGEGERGMDGAPGGVGGGGRDGERDERGRGAQGGFALWEGVAVREGVERGCAERVEDWWKWSVEVQCLDFGVGNGGGAH